MSFQVEKVTEDIVRWIRDWFEKNGKGCNAERTARSRRRSAFAHWVRSV